jgi:predicted ATP-dependent serine protease
LRALTPAQILAEAPTATLESLPVLGREGLIIRGWSHVVAGPPKVGKTELLLACAREWVGAGLRVHWISEEGVGVWAERFRRAGAPDGLLVTPALGADSEELLKHALAVDAEVTIVDTIRTLWRVDELDNPVIAGMFARWNAALLGKTLIYVHHERKGGGQHGEGVAGGFAFVGSVDRVIEVLYDPNQENRRRLRFLSRIESPPELVYELNPDGCLILRGEPTALAREEVRRSIVALADDAWRTLAEFLELLPKP